MSQRQRILATANRKTPQLVPFQWFLVHSVHLNPDPHLIPLFFFNTDWLPRRFPSSHLSGAKCPPRAKKKIKRALPFHQNKRGSGPASKYPLCWSVHIIIKSEFVLRGWPVLCWVSKTRANPQPHFQIGMFSWFVLCFSFSKCKLWCLAALAWRVSIFMSSTFFFFSIVKKTPFMPQSSLKPLFGGENTKPGILVYHSQQCHLKAEI